LTLSNQKEQIDRDKSSSRNPPRKNAKVTHLNQKTVKNVEGYPKNKVLASDGDFQQYLYEAPIFPMPSANRGIKKPQIHAFSAFRAIFEVFDFVLSDKTFTVFSSDLFR
jgi:hypothetical protein